MSVFVFNILFYLIVLPVAAGRYLMRTIARCDTKKPDTYFHDVKYGKGISLCGVAFHSLYTASLTALLFPCVLLAKCFSKKLFSPLVRGYSTSPNEVSVLIADKLRRSMLLTQKVAQDAGAEYLFCLQPTLLDGEHPLTEDDTRFVESRRQTNVMGFPYTEFFEAYYRTVRYGLAEDPELKESFVDLGKIFHGKKPSRFIDTCHLGNTGQDELAQSLLRTIIVRDKKS
ncbi:MAG: hypothetical protein OCC46_10040 [Pseudodesulfovibrio sp.]